MSLTVLIAGLIGLFVGLCLAIVIALNNHKLRCQINNRPKTRYEDIDWTKADLSRYEDIRDLLRECIRSGKYNSPVIEKDLDWLLEIINQATKNNKV